MIDRSASADRVTLDALAELEAVLAHVAGAKTLTVAYSGGVDSTVVGAVARRVLGDRCRVVLIDSPLMSRREFSAAIQTAESADLDLEIVTANPLCATEVAENDSSRCYHCKRILMSALVDEYGLPVVDGSNADDVVTPRPGLKALGELGVRSPLADATISKAMVRAIARYLNLPNADKPSAPCAATRFPFGTPLDQTIFEPLSWAEHRLRDAAFQDVRVRLERVEDPNPICRVEPGNPLPEGCAEPHTIVRAVQVSEKQLEDAEAVIEDIEHLLEDSGLEIADHVEIEPYKRADPV